MAQQSKLINEMIDDYFKVKNKSDGEIFKQLSLYIYSLESPDSDLYMLAKIVPEPYLSNLVSYFAGSTINIPSNEEYRRGILLSICYYLKEIKNYSWIEIKDFLNFSENNKDLFSSISLGKSINKLNDKINKELYEIVKNIEIEDAAEFIKTLSK